MIFIDTSAVFALASARDHFPAAGFRLYDA